MKHARVVDPVDENLFSADDQDLVQTFFFELSQRHPMFLEEFDEMFARNPPILAAGNTVAAQPAIRPRADALNS